MPRRELDLSKTNVMVWAEEGAIRASAAAQIMGRASFTDGRLTSQEKTSTLRELEEASSKINDAMVAIEEGSA